MNSLRLTPKVLRSPRPARRSERCRILPSTALLMTLLVGASWLEVGLVETLADTVSLTSVADSYIRQGLPDANGGGEPNMVSGQLGDRGQFDLRRSLLRFDTSGIPAGSTVNSVTLRVTVVMTPLTPAQSVFDVRRLLQDWTEFGVTWNSRTAAAPWQVPGASGAGDVAGAASSSVLVINNSPPTTPVPYTIPSTPALVADVQGWVNNPTSNFGWLLTSESESTSRTARRFATRETANNAPVLVIDYTPGSTPTLSILTQPQSQSGFEGDTVSFQVVAGGTPPFSYQWFFEGNRISNATIDTLTLTNVQTNQSGSYTVTVTNASGSITSTPAILTVQPLSPGLPFVQVTSPTNGAKFAAHSNVLLVADARESNGVIRQVEFFLGTNSAGIATAPPFSVTTNNVPAGTYIVTAKAADDRGTNATSSPVMFSLINPPTVSLTVPGSGVAIGSNVTVTATVISVVRIVSVDFFASRAGQPGVLNIGSASAPPYTITWAPPQLGDYALTAAALDEFGQTGQSGTNTIHVFVTELILPTITVTEGPRNFARVTNSPITLAGTAADNIAVDHVEYQVVSGPLLQTIGSNITVQGTINWIGEIPLVPGRNAVRLRSVDQAGNKSAVLTRYYTYVITAPVVIRINGSGTVTPNLDGRSLQLGNIYTVTARPGLGQVFAWWQGVAVTNNPKLSFKMSSNLVLTAAFVPNPFPPLAGSYSGLFFDADTNRFRIEDAGRLTLQLGSKGTFSGKVTLQGALHSFHGRFDFSGKVRVPIARPARAPLSLALQLDLNEATGTLTGSVTNAVGTNSLASPLLAVRKAFDSRTPAPQKGRYSFELRQLAEQGGQVLVTANADVSSIGQVSIRGKANGSQSFVISTFLVGIGAAPLYLSLDHGNELFIGWLDFGTDFPPYVTGEVFYARISESGVMLLEASPP